MSTKTDRITVLILATFAAILLAWGTQSVFAGQRDVTVINDAVQAALAARDAGEGYDEAKAELYAIATDTDTDLSCRRYADLALLGMLVVDIAEPYPDSEALGIVMRFIIEQQPVQQNACLLAI